MKKHRLLKTLIGLAVAGGVIGCVLAYLTRGSKKSAEDLEEEFQDFNDEECQEWVRNYTTIPAGAKENEESEDAPEA